ncbi:MAG: fluoride efflux transporter CrcB [Planctomycetota bacterium]|nr:fluoride efflux transporter CrcB [Planctomycetota bacterium]
MRELVWIALGGAAGAVSRYLVTLGCQRWAENFPAATLIVNVAGCFCLGALLQSTWLPATARLALGTGLLGGLTTFSTFGHETFRALEKGHWGLALGNTVANLILGILAVWAGVALVQRWGNA